MDAETKEPKNIGKNDETGSIKDIIEELGFDSQGNFNRYCKQHFGCTPKQLIEQCQATNQTS